MNKRIDRILAKVISDFKFGDSDVKWVLEFYADEIEQIRINIINVVANSLKKNASDI